MEYSLSQSPWHEIAVALNIICWTAFAVEWATMMYVVPDRVAWLKSHWIETLIVFLAVPVAFPGAGGFRLLRLSRLFRLVWVAKRARQVMSPQGLPYVALVALVCVVGAGAAFALMERPRHVSMWEGMWWSATTVTTVGYGDESPHTTAGKFLALFVMVIGIGFVAVLTGSIAQYFVRNSAGEDAAEKHDELISHIREMSARIEALEGSLAVKRDSDLEYADSE